MADRTDMVEGVIDDLRRGHVPNVLADIGLGAAWKHDRPQVLRSLAWAAGSAVLLLLAGRPRAPPTASVLSGVPLPACFQQANVCAGCAITGSARAIHKPV